MIENCPYKSNCNGRDCDKDFCIKKYRLDCLYDNSLIPEPLRKYKKLFTDSDGTDYQEFLQLAEIEKTKKKLLKRVIIYIYILQIQAKEKHHGQLDY